VDTAQAHLGRICVEIQDRLEKSYETIPKLPHHVLPYPRGLTVSERQMWDRMFKATNKCSLSHYILWKLIDDFIFGSKELSQTGSFETANSQPGQQVPVKNVQEMEFLPSYYYRTYHTAYIIIMEDGSEFIFDPTGLQFGPGR
jgi:hypothetical protein